MSERPSPLPSPMLSAIAKHREAHERYRLAQTYHNIVPGGSPEWTVADERSTATSEAMAQAFQALGCVAPQDVADIGALAVHLRMVLATAEHYEGEFAPAKECFDLLECACAALAGRPAPPPVPA